MNVLTDGFNNSILPFDPRVNKSGSSLGFGVPEGSVAAGSVQVVLIEVMMSKLIRMALRMDNISLGKLVIIHAISLPLVGGIVGFSEPQVGLADGPAYSAAFMDGAKGVPAIFLAQYITNTALQGLHAPKLKITDILITASSRILTRPLLNFLYQYMPKAVQGNFDANDDLVRAQNLASRFKKSVV
jgi:hypothetical protein